MKKIKHEHLASLIQRENERNFVRSIDGVLDFESYIPIKCNGFTIGDAKTHPVFDGAVILNLYISQFANPVPENFKFKFVKNENPRMEAWIL